MDRLRSTLIACWALFGATALAQSATAIPNIFPTGIRIKVTPVFTATGDGAVVVSFLAIDANDLDYYKVGNRSHTRIIVVAELFAEDGHKVDTRSQIYSATLNPAQLAEVRKAGIFYELRHPVVPPGVYTVRALATEYETGRIGRAAATITVPDVSNGKLAISTIVMSDASFALDSDPSSSGMRIFRQGSKIAYSYQVLNAATDENRKIRMDTLARLFRGDAKVYEGESKPLPIEGDIDPKRFMVTGVLTLDGRVIPGSYFLELTVFDRVAGKDSVTQRMDFQIR